MNAPKGLGGSPRIISCQEKLEGLCRPGGPSSVQRTPTRSSPIASVTTTITTAPTRDCLRAGATGGGGGIGVFMPTQ